MLVLKSMFMLVLLLLILVQAMGLKDRFTSIPSYDGMQAFVRVLPEWVKMRTLLAVILTEQAQF